MSLRVRLLLVAILLLAGGLRFARLARDSFWMDEGLTIYIAHRPLSLLVHEVYNREMGPPLYDGLLWLWVHALGDSEFAARFPSAVAGVASVYLAFSLARRLFGSDEAGLLAAFLLAISPYHIHYSQEARTYPFLFLFAVWSCELYARLTPASRGRTQLAYVLVSTLLIYTHLYGGFVLLAQNVAYFAGRMRALPLRRWAVLQASIAVLFTPWVNPAYETYRFMNAGYFYAKSIHADVFPAAVLAYASTPLLGLLLCTLAATALLQFPRRPAVITLCLGLAIFPVLFPVLISWATHPVFIIRYGITTLIGLDLLAAAALAALPRPAQFAAAAVLAALAVPSLLHPPDRREDWRSAAGYVCDHAAPGDSVVVTMDFAHFVFAHYCPRTDIRIDPEDRPAVPGPPENLPAGAPLPRVWVVTHYPVPTVRELLAGTNYQLAAIKWFREITVFELEPLTPSPGAAQSRGGRSARPDRPRLLPVG